MKGAQSVMKITMNSTWKEVRDEILRQYKDTEFTQSEIEDITLGFCKKDKSILHFFYKYMKDEIEKLNGEFSFMPRACYSMTYSLSNDENVLTIRFKRYYNGQTFWKKIYYLKDVTIEGVNPEEKIKDTCQRIIQKQKFRETDGYSKAKEITRKLRNHGFSSYQEFRDFKKEIEDYPIESIKFL